MTVETAVDVTGLPEVQPRAVAVLVIALAIMSSGVDAYVPVQEVLNPAPRFVTPHAMPVTFASETEIALIITLPTLRTA